MYYVRPTFYFGRIHTMSNYRSKSFQVFSIAVHLYGRCLWQYTQIEIETGGNVVCPVSAAKTYLQATGENKKVKSSCHYEPTVLRFSFQIEASSDLIRQMISAWIQPSETHQAMKAKDEHN